MTYRVGWPVVVLWTALTALTLAACAAPVTQAPRPTATPFTGTPRPVIIDTDMAADDWLAILYTLQRPDLAVVAITVTGAGEAHCGPGVRNALSLTALAGQPAIPVACGREAPLRGNHTFPSAWRENVDALLGLRLPESALAPAAQTAPELMASLAQASPEPMTLLTLGPLTNVAEALQADPAVSGHLAMIYIMGGAVDVSGNVAGSGAGLDDNTGAEWNIYVDPYAANVVLQSGTPVTFVPLDATNHAPVTSSFYQKLAGQRTTPEAQFAYDVLTQEKDFLESGGLYFWDPLAAAVLSDESLASFESRRLAVVEAEGDDSGRLIAADEGAAVRFAASADGARFESLFLETLNAP
jgi:pyrimidine-specific ribonucleoside hydrolase